MATFRGLTANRAPLEAFKAKVQQPQPGKRDTPPSSQPTIPLHLLEWAQNAAEGTEIGGIKSVDELESRSHGAVRVIFAPQDVPSPGTVEGFCELFEKCGIPSAFIEEGLLGVSQSFAAQKDVDGTTYVWFHFLCKDIAVMNHQIVHLPIPGDIKNKDYQERLEAQSQSQANFTWLKPGFVLKIKDQSARSPRPTRTNTASSGKTLILPSTHAKVEMFCFGAPMALGDRLRKLKTNSSCEDLLQDPYVFLEIVMDEIYKVMDHTGWAISDIFGAIETETLGMASAPGQATKTLKKAHFTSLHNLAKHTIYLRENCESALATLDDLRDHHKAVISDHPNPSQELTRQAFKYRKTLFQSTQRRLASLDARMANIIQLSFHIVTQGDSRLMQSENQSMKTIAVMTLVFMPLSTVAGIFGTQFMKLQDEKPYHVTVSQDFWLLWVIAVPLTVIVMVIWRVWYMDARGRLVDEIPQRPDDEHGYMGWKTLKQSIQREHKKTTHGLGEYKQV